MRMAACLLTLGVFLGCNVQSPDMYSDAPDDKTATIPESKPGGEKTKSPDKNVAIPKYKKNETYFFWEVPPGRPAYPLTEESYRKVGAVWGRGLAAAAEGKQPEKWTEQRYIDELGEPTKKETEDGSTTLSWIFYAKDGTLAAEFSANIESGGGGLQVDWAHVKDDWKKAGEKETSGKIPATGAKNDQYGWELPKGAKPIPWNQASFDRTMKAGRVGEPNEILEALGTPSRKSVQGKETKYEWYFVAENGMVVTIYNLETTTGPGGGYISSSNQDERYIKPEWLEKYKDEDDE